MSNDSGPTMERLEEQIEWYDTHGIANLLMFLTQKTIVIVAAALIPFVSGLKLSGEWLGIGVTQWISGGFGVLIAILESLQQLFQYHANWIGYRNTCESLRHEKFLFLAKAGPYASAKDPRVLLAERIESLVSQENAKWAAAQKSPERVKKSEGAAVAASEK
jgi:Protein of unknown function (DUF4231)